METKNIKIDVPEGWEIDKENSTFENIIFKKKEKLFPTEWKDFKTTSGWYVSACSTITELQPEPSRETNFNTWQTKELAEASLALCQLVRYRDAWNNGWVPNWTKDDEVKYVILVISDKLVTRHSILTQSVLYFNNSKIRDNFFIQFKHLLRIAKPLL